MKKKEYLTFVHSIADLPDGKTIKLVIKDLTPGPRKYDARYVQARLSKEPLEGDDVLWVRSRVGYLYPKSWSIKIIKELPEYVPGHPYMDIYEAVKQWA